MPSSYHRLGLNIIGVDNFKENPATVIGIYLLTKEIIL
jgi:hypothetical protein